MSDFGWVDEIFPSHGNNTGEPILGSAVSWTEFIVMVVSSTLSLGLILFYCCRLWIQTLCGSQYNELQGPLINKSDEKFNVNFVHQKLPSFSKVFLMPDGSFNYGLEDSLSECRLSPSSANKFKQLGFQINNSQKLQSQQSLSRMGSSTQNGLREIVIFEDADSNFDQRSLAAKSFASRASELFKVDDDDNDNDDVENDDNRDKDKDSEVFQT